MVQKEKVKIGIVGYGFVGQAIDYAFTHDLVDKFYVCLLYTSDAADE